MKTICFLLSVVLCATFAWSQSPQADPQNRDEADKPSDPISVTLLKMDLDGATNLLMKHDLDDDGSLSDNEFGRLGWQSESVKRFDVNRSGDLQHVEIALRLAEERLEHGIVQMDATLADRYTRQYDANRDGILQLSELKRNTFTDQASSFDTNGDDELSAKEFLIGLATERQFRDELGMKGCDQGGAMKLLNQGDADGNRRLDESELDTLGLKSTVIKFDRDGDGQMGISELAEYFASRRQSMGLTPSDQLTSRGLFRQFDRDRDGTIDADEFPQTSLGGFADFDTNKDGSVTQTEIEKHFAVRRKELGYGDDAAKRASLLIQRNDQNADRKLSRQEMPTGGKTTNQLSPQKLPLIDTDDDQFIALDELARYLEKLDD